MSGIWNILSRFVPTLLHSSKIVIKILMMIGLFFFSDMFPLWNKFLCYFPFFFQLLGYVMVKVVILKVESYIMILKVLSCIWIKVLCDLED